MNNLENSVHGLVAFNITDNMKKAGISDFALNREFLFKFDSGGMCVVTSKGKSDSVSKIMKRIKTALVNRLEGEFEAVALQDIESQLIERHDEIFSHNDKSDSFPEDEYTSQFFEKVTVLRRKREEPKFTFEDWQKSVHEKYETLRTVTERNFPEAWPLLQFCLAVKSILHINGCTLPFMGVILAIPSSMKTLVIQLFRKYPYSVYSDSFTPNSFESHNASLSEEQLQKIDLLPKLNNKLFLTPELAPVFTTNEDELRKSLGIITRILDGHGLETDSGAQGHRRYGNINFVWVGAAVEIPYRVWNLLGTLGHKIYMLRPIIHDKEIQDLEKIAKENDFQKRFKETQECLIEYLISLDAVPQCSNATLDENGIVKVKWDENKGGDQDKAIFCIAQFANLLKRLRGTVYISESKSFHHRAHEKVQSTKDNPDEGKEESRLASLDGSDYDTDYPIVEDPSRAVVLLRNLALGHAISQGRNYLSLDDMPLIIDVALSTTTRARSELVKILFKRNGELTTSEIVRQNKVSPTFAKKTMRELGALGIVNFSSVARYNNSELKITLKNEYSWFKGEQFRKLSNNYTNPTGSREIDKNKTMEENKNSDAKNISSQIKNAPESQSQSHDDTKSRTEGGINNFESLANSNYAAKNIDESSTVAKDKKGMGSASECGEENDTSLRRTESIQNVTVTRLYEQNATDLANHNLALKEIIEVIKDGSGSQVSFNSAVELAVSKNQSVKAYLGDKLTSRENKKVRNLSVEIIRNKNIEYVRHKPQLVFRWIDG